MANEKRLIDADKAKFFIADILDIFNVPVGDRMEGGFLVVNGWLVKPFQYRCKKCGKVVR